MTGYEDIASTFAEHSPGAPPVPEALGALSSAQPSGTGPLAVPRRGVRRKLALLLSVLVVTGAAAGSGAIVWSNPILLLAFPVSPFTGPGQLADGSYDCYYQWGVGPPDPVTAAISGDRISWNGRTYDYGPMPSEDPLFGPHFGIRETRPDGGFGLREIARKGIAYGAGLSQLECWPSQARPSLSPTGLTRLNG